MNEEQVSQNPVRRSWFDRISNILLSGPKDRAQLIEMLRESRQRHLLDTDALTMIEGVLEVAEMQVRDIIIPRAQMVVVDRDASLDQILPVIIESAHSRFPVVGDNKDEVVGILMAKDLLAYCMGKSDTPFSVRDILRPAVFIPESKRLNVLLKEFRARRNHMAIVVDEYGRVAGLVTIEDVLEQIVGDIIDEHDVDEDVYILQHSDTNYSIKALTPIDEFNECFNSNFSDEEFDTIGGLLINEFGHLPKRGEICDIGRFHFKILHSDSRRIRLIQVVLRSLDETSVAVSSEK